VRPWPGWTTVSSGSARSLCKRESIIFSIEPPHKSVRPMLPAKSVSPAKSCGAGMVTFPESAGKKRHELPGVCPGVWITCACRFAPLQLVPLPQKLVHFGEWRRFDSKKRGLHVHCLIERNVVVVHQNGSTGVIVQLFQSADVVDVRMRADNGLHLKFVPAEQIHDAMNFVARIEHESFASDWITDDRAIALKQADRHGEVQKFLRNLRGRFFRHATQYNIHLRT